MILNVKRVISNVEKLNKMIQKFYHEFKGFGRVPSRCLVKRCSTDEKNIILFVDLNEALQ